MGQKMIKKIRFKEFLISEFLSIRKMGVSWTTGNNPFNLFDRTGGCVCLSNRKY